MCDHGQHGTLAGTMVEQGISGFTPWDKCAEREMSLSAHYIQTFPGNTRYKQSTVVAVEMQCSEVLFLQQ